MASASIPARVASGTDAMLLAFLESGAAYGGAKPERRIDTHAATIFWLEASESVRVRRIGGRESDASDATAAVARAQKADAPLASWTRITTGGPFDEVLAALRAGLGLPSAHA